jgi:hypothetical protein
MEIVLYIAFQKGYDNTLLRTMQNEFIYRAKYELK